MAKLARVVWACYLELMHVLVVAGIYSNRHKRLAAVTLIGTVVSECPLLTCTHYSCPHHGMPPPCMPCSKGHEEYYFGCRCSSWEHLRSPTALGWTPSPHPKVRYNTPTPTQPFNLLPHTLGQTHSGRQTPIAGMEAEYDFPTDFTPCTLSRYALDDYYSLKVAAPNELLPGTLWHKQEAALRKLSSNPPVGWTRSMAPLANDTVEGVMIKALRECMGCLHKHYNMPPTMEIVMDPKSMSIYWGFLKAKQGAPDTIKMRFQQLSQAVDFVMSKFCPKAPNRNWSSGYIHELKHWYTTLAAKLLVDCSRAPKPTHAMGLWDAWIHAEGSWLEFVKAFQVTKQCIHACVEKSGACTTNGCTLACRIIMGNGTGNWQGTARLVC